MDKQQIAINKLLNSIKTQRNVYDTYGYIVRVYSSTLLIFADFFIVSFRLLTFLALWLKKKNIDKHLFNIDITKIMDVIKKW